MSALETFAWIAAWIALSTLLCKAIDALTRKH